MAEIKGGEFGFKDSAVLSNADDLKNVVTRLKQLTDELKSTVNRFTGTDLELDWALKAGDDWKEFSEKDMEKVFTNITKASETLERDVDIGVKYSKGEE